MPLEFLFRSAAEEEAVALFRQQLVAAVWRPSSDEMHAALAAWEAKLVDTLHHWRHPELWMGFARWRADARACLQLQLAARTHLAAARAPLRAAATRRRRARRQWDRWVVEHEPQHWRRALRDAVAAWADYLRARHDNHGASLHHEERALCAAWAAWADYRRREVQRQRALLASMRAALAEALEAWRQWRKLHRAESDRRRRALLTWRAAGQGRGMRTACPRARRRRRAPAARRPRSARDSGAPRAARSHSGERGTRRWP